MIERKGRIAIPGSDLTVSRLCLGGLKLGSVLDEDTSFGLLDYFVEQGGNFIDTVQIYADWLPGAAPSCSEKTLGRWLSARSIGSDLVLATKIGHPRVGTLGVPRLDRASLRGMSLPAWTILVSAASISSICTATTRRDLSKIYSVSLRRCGGRNCYGTTASPIGCIGEAQLATKAASWQGIVANQPKWSVAWRNPSSTASDLIQMDATAFHLHQRTSLAATPYSSQAKGYFDKLLVGALDAATTRAFHNPANAELARRLDALAVTYKTSASSIALAVVLAAPFPTIPIIGSHTQIQIESSFRCLTIDLLYDLIMQFLNRWFQ